MPEANRKLAAILSADVVGYSRLMGADEAGTVETLTAYRAAMGRLITRHKGRVVNAPGDALLAEFPSAVEAVQCAVEIQKSLEGRNIDLVPERRMVFRIGVNLGDVIEQADGAIYGDGVNIAARMEALAEGGGICISSTIYDAVEGKLDLGFDFLGEQQVKNIAKPVKVYRVRALPAPLPAGKRPSRRAIRWASAAVAGALLVTLVGLAAWFYLDLGPPAEISEAEDPILALPKGPSIAVLPFTNLSGDPEQEYFVDGLTEEIITELTRFRKLFVIARNTTAQYKGRAVDIKEIGRELGVRYVVEGSVRKSADSIRVTAQLLDATTGGHLWAETYDRDLTASNLFAVQDDITGQVVATIAESYGVLARSMIALARPVGTESLDAYDCVLRYWAFLATITPQDLRLARDCLERAVVLDPGYAEAWSALALTYTYMHFQAYDPPPDVVDRALAAAQRAVELDPTSEFAHLALAQSYFFRHDLDAYRVEADRVLALNPNNATMVAYIGIWSAFSGDWDRGVALMRKAMALNPNHYSWFHFPAFYDHYRKNEYEAALAAAQEMNMPGFWHAQALLAMALGQLGRTAEAQAAMAEARALNPEFAADPRRFWRMRNFSPELIEHVVDGLRKAGLEVPPEQ